MTFSSTVSRILTRIMVPIGVQGEIIAFDDDVAGRLPNQGRRAQHQRAHWQQSGAGHDQKFAQFVHCRHCTVRNSPRHMLDNRIATRYTFPQSNIK